MTYVQNTAFFFVNSLIISHMFLMNSGTHCLISFSSLLISHSCLFPRFMTVSFIVWPIWFNQGHLCGHGIGTVCWSVVGSVMGIKLKAITCPFPGSKYTMHFHSSYNSFLESVCSQPYFPIGHQLSVFNLLYLFNMLYTLFFHLSWSNVLKRYFRNVC